MRTKLFVLMALFVAFSTVSFAQTAAQDVTADLTETRTLSFDGFSEPSMTLTRLSTADLSDPLKWQTSAALINVTSDLGINQKITVEAALTTGDWAGRYLTVTPDDTTTAWTTSTPSEFGTEITLISNGTVSAVQDLVTGIKPTTGATLGDYEQLDVTYKCAAGPLASAGSNKATITYTMTDE